MTLSLMVCVGYLSLCHVTHRQSPDAAAGRLTLVGALVQSGDMAAVGGVGRLEAAGAAGGRPVVGRLFDSGGAAAG